MNIDDRVDKILSGQKEPRLKKWHYLLLLVVMLSLGSVLALPFFQRKEGGFDAQQLLVSDLNKNKPVGDEISQPLFYKKTNGFGIDGFFIPNWSYWDDKIGYTLFCDDVNITHTLDINTSQFVNCRKYTYFYRTQNKGYHNLTITFDTGADNITIDNNSVVFEYSEMNLSFNWSDLIKYELDIWYNISGDVFTFSVADELNKNQNIELDPRFGDQNEYATNWASSDDALYTNYSNPASDGTVDWGQAYFRNQNAGDVALHLYYADNLSKVANGQSDTLSLGAEGGFTWHNFSWNPDPNIREEYNYCICIGSTGGNTKSMVQTTGGDSGWDKNCFLGGINNFPDPLVEDTSYTYIMSAFVHYNEVAGEEPTSGINVTGLSTNSVYNDTVSWNATSVDVATSSKWINSSGFRDETIEVAITVNATTNVSQLDVWVGDMNHSVSGHQINASNVTLWVSGDNATWTVCGDGHWGCGDGVFPDGGGNLSINSSTWDEPSDNPFNYYGNGTHINEDCDIYLRLELNMSYISGFEGGNYTNRWLWYVYVYNDTWIFYDEGLFNGTFNYSEIVVRNWEQIQTWNFSYSNTSIEQQIQTWNFSYSNPAEHTQVQSWNFSYSNGSALWHQLETWTFSYSNSSSEVVTVHPGVYFDIEGGDERYGVLWVMNFTRIIVNDTWIMFNDTDFNITCANFVNITLAYIDEDTVNQTVAGTQVVWFWCNTTVGNIEFNVSGFNASTDYYIMMNDTFYQNVNSDAGGCVVWSDNRGGARTYEVYKGTWTVSNWEQVQTWNFSYSNTTSEHQVQTWNFSYSNASAETSVQTWNFSYSNTSRVFRQVQSWNFSYSNSTPPLAWYQQFTWNFSYSNSTPPLFSITNEYPINESFIYDLQPTVFFTLSHPQGHIMNYSVYTGVNASDCIHLLASGSNVDNGTYNCNEYYNATNYTRYFYRISANDGTEWLNETLWFNCSTEPQMIGGNGLAIGVAMAGCMLAVGFIFIMIRRRREDEYY